MNNNALPLSSKKLFVIVLGLFVFTALLLFGNIDSSNPKVGYTLAIAVLMAIWWVTEAIPLAITSLLPVILFPLLGVMNGKDVSATYFNHVIFLFIGGFIVAIATLVGTPPNLSFARIFQVMFTEAPDISFSQWLFFALPVSFVFFIITLSYLYFIYKPKKGSWTAIEKSTFKIEYEELGPVSYEQKIIFIDFVLLALLWLFRSNISIGSFTIPGWSNLFSHPEYINDGTVAIIMAILLFMLPATLSASMAFMLPVATPPNAIIFGTNRLRVMEMAKTGFVLNILGAIVITLATYFLSEYVFGFDMQLFPEWAKM